MNSITGTRSPYLAHSIDQTGSGFSMDITCTLYPAQCQRLRLRRMDRTIPGRSATGAPHPGRGPVALTSSGLPVARSRPRRGSGVGPTPRNLRHLLFQDLPNDGLDPLANHLLQPPKAESLDFAPPTRAFWPMGMALFARDSTPDSGDSRHLHATPPFLSITPSWPLPPAGASVVSAGSSVGDSAGRSIPKPSTAAGSPRIDTHVPSALARLRARSVPTRYGCRPSHRESAPSRCSGSSVAFSTPGSIFVAGSKHPAGLPARVAGRARCRPRCSSTPIPAMTSRRCLPCGPTRPGGIRA